MWITPSFQIWDYVLHVAHISCVIMNCGGWVRLWGFLWWAPSAKRKDHHGVSSGWSSVWHCSNTGLSSTKYGQILIILGVWPFWLTSVCHPFSSLNSSLGFAGGNHCQKITIPIFRLVLQNFAIPGCFPYIRFYHYLFSLLSSGWFVIAVCGSISVRELVKCLESLLTDVELLFPMTSQLYGCPHFLYARLKNGTYYAVAIFVRPSVRPRFPDFSSTCFEISIWNLVYTFSRWHDMSSLSCNTIGSLWPSLQPKVGQTYFLQSWSDKSR